MTEKDPSGKEQHESGAKLDAGKNRLGLVLGGFAHAIEAVGIIGTEGAAKYTPNGWLDVHDGEARYRDAMLRHDNAESKGELYDQKSRSLHAAHRAWNALAALELLIRKGSPIKDFEHVMKEEDIFDLIKHLSHQREWSETTFGPGPRPEGITDHISKELDEIRENPDDLEEWIDVVILALDGAWRAGFNPIEIVEALAAKQAKNENRTWPDWRTAEPGKAIEHVEEEEPSDRWEIVIDGASQNCYNKESLLAFLGEINDLDKAIRDGIIDAIHACKNYCTISLDSESKNALKAPYFYLWKGEGE